MTRKKRTLLATVIVLSVLLVAWVSLRPRGNDLGRAEVRRQPFEVWSVYEGTLEARSLKTIVSKRQGMATIEEIVPEGTAVKVGDVLVRFDGGEDQKDLVRLERDYALAKAEMESLEKAKLPLEVQDLETRVIDAKIQAASEEEYLNDSRELLAEGLISEQEVKKQEIKAAAAQTLVRNLEQQIELTKTFLHPSQVERARVTLDSSAQELALAQERLSNSVVTAPVEGLVVYRPVYVSGEMRPVRVGDTIYRHQTIMVIPDMRDPVVQCNVPEAEMSKVSAGCRAIVVPVAYPDLHLDGEIESIGSMAQSVMGKPVWQKYLQISIRLKNTDPRLRSGMSVRVNILSYSNADALLVPRAAVQWEGETAFCEVRRRGRIVRRDLKLGFADERSYEVKSGLEEGEVVVVP